MKMVSYKKIDENTIEFTNIRIRLRTRAQLEKERQDAITKRIHIQQMIDKIDNILSILNG